MKYLLLFFSLKGKTSRLPYFISVVLLLGLLYIKINFFIALVLTYSFVAVHVKRYRDIGWNIGYVFLFLALFIAFVDQVNLNEFTFWLWSLWSFIVGIVESKNSKINQRNKEQNVNFKENEETHNNKSHNSSAYRIVSCPSCKQKLKVKIPLTSSVIKCSNCSTRFELEIDSNGHIYINKLDNNQEANAESEINTIEDCFEILNLQQNATPVEIKKSYKKKMAEYHPDKVEKLGEKLKNIANEESKKINSAYMILKEQGYL